MGNCGSNDDSERKQNHDRPVRPVPAPTGERPEAEEVMQAVKTGDEEMLRRAGTTGFVLHGMIHTAVTEAVDDDAMRRAIDELVAQKVKVDGKIKEASALHVAASLPNEAAIEHLVREHNADIHLRDNSGRTPLHLATLANHTSTMQCLLKLGASANNTDAIGSTPLHTTCSEGRLEATLILLEAGANYDVRDRDDSTPLILAYANNEDAIVDALTKHGAK